MRLTFPSGITLHSRREMKSASNKNTNATNGLAISANQKLPR